MNEDDNGVYENLVLSYNEEVENLLNNA